MHIAQNWKNIRFCNVSLLECSQHSFKKMTQGNLILEICMDRKCQILMLDFGFIVRHCSGGYMQSERKKVICKIESHLNSKIYPS